MDIFPTAYFGPIAYYKAYVNAPQPQIEAKEHFMKQTIRTRCELLGPNGKQLLSVPVERVNGNKTPIDALKIVEDGWRKIHWKTIETAYASAAHFDYYGMEVKQLLEMPFERLIDFNDAVHQRVLSWVDVDIASHFTSEYIVHPVTDFRAVQLDTASTSLHPNYHQVFRDRTHCMHNLSILDLIFNQGPMARNWLFEK